MKAKYITIGFVLMSVLSPGLLEGRESDFADFYADRPDLRRFIELALKRNPGIQQSLALYRAALQEVPQATALPDPTLGYTQFLSSVETRVGPQRNTFAVSQRFPWFGKLDLKGQSAAKAAQARYQLFRAREREVIQLVKQAFYEVAYADQAMEITRKEQNLLEHYERLAQSRYGTGQGLRQAVIKIHAELTRNLNRLESLSQQRESAVARLNTLMDQPPELSIPPVSPLQLPTPVIDLEELKELGNRNRQELRAAAALIEKAEKDIELAKRDFWPDFSLSAGLVNVGSRGDPAGRLSPPTDNGKDAYTFSVGMNIPIWREKYRAGVAEATERLIAEKRSYSTLQNSVEFWIRDQLVKLTALREQVDLLEEALIPQLEEALRSTELAYETGQVGALDLLDSERMLLEVRLVHARYYTDLWIALSIIERSIGTKFPR